MTGLPNQRSRSFAQAAFSFDGTRDYERVETFISTAKKYKSIKNIGDVDALRSLHIILKGDAAAWWNGIKDKITTWKEFESALKKEFAPVKPAYIIYQEISELRQRPDELTERFVAKQRALFNQLPPPELSETVQLDMMYGFLHPKIQEQIPRESIETFDGLVEAARVIEQANLKAKTEATSSENRSGRKRVRCNFCRNFGHLAEVCRKKQKVISELEVSPESTSAENPETSSKTPEKEVEKGFTLNLALRPMIEISIGTANEMAYVDTGAVSSVASHKLYDYLKNIGFHFQKENTTVTMADGIPKTVDVLTGKVPVKIKGRCVLTNFMVLPEARETKTLLGIGFLTDAGIVLNLPQLIWNFIDEPNVHYDLIEEDS